MTAAELYAIVKDVPKDAWPSPIFFLEHHDGKTPGFWIIPDGFPIERLWDSHAELLFIGSMVNYLIGEGYHSFNFVLGDDDVTLELYDKTFRTPLDCGSKVQTTTKLLAAACKQIGEPK